MNRFARAAARLRRLGISPAAMALGGATATYTTVVGFSWRHLVAASVGGAIFSFGAIGILMAESDRWLSNRSERAIIEGVEASGVDVRAMSAADLAARLSYSPEDGRALVDAIGHGQKLLVDDIARWLRSMEPERRRPAMQTVLKLSNELGTYAGKFLLAKAITEIDEVTAASLAETDDVAQLLRKFAAIPLTERRALIDANFPVRPADEVRAGVWAVVNSKNFPAADLVAPLTDLARAHPTRLDEIRRYVQNGEPLRRCEAVACTPVYCQSPLSRGYTCDPGFYMTDSVPTCVPYPIRKSSNIGR